MARSDLLLRTLKLLSQRAGEIQPFLAETGCLNPEEREIIGLCEAYKVLIHGDNKETPKKDDFWLFLENQVIPAMQKIDMSKWARTELSDLGFIIGNKDEVNQDIENLAEHLTSEELEI